MAIRAVQPFGFVIEGDPARKVYRTMSEAQAANDSLMIAEQARQQRNQDFFGTPSGMGKDYLDQAFIAGTTYGKKEFEQDPRMQQMLARREDLAKGYDGETLGALRQLARQEIAGSQASSLANLRSSAARSGVSGARGAAMMGAAQDKGTAQIADAERKMMLDQAGEIRKGTEGLENFLFNQKYGTMGTGAGFAQLASSERAAQAQEKAARSGGGNSCCFIMLEARYGNGTMDAVVRRFRDENLTDRNKRGYYKLAEVLVPLMRKSKFVKFVVTKTFADPLVSYGKYHYGEGKIGFLFKPVANFWLKMFDYLGQDHEFIRENGEVI